jgi:hypothetical protein
MAVEVYWWPPSGGNIGHAAIKVDGGSPPGIAYLSAWPGSLLSIFLVGQGDYHQFDDDVSSEGNRQPQVARILNLNETAIKNQISVFQSAKTYSFLGANCATQASICLNAGVPGATIRQILDLMGGPMGYFFGTSVINTPWTLFLYAKSLAT